MSDIYISEIFGPTIQGEGYHIGYPTIFVRVGGCDYKCNWCDSMYAVSTDHKNEWEKMNEWKIFEKIKELTNNKPMMVTLSGGNPAMYDFKPLIDLGKKEGYIFTAETQGSIPRKWFNLLDYTIISPKPPSSGMKTDMEKLDQSIKMVDDPKKVSLKVVVDTVADLEYTIQIFEKYPEYSKFITPCNSSPGEPNLSEIFEKTRIIIDQCFNRNQFNISILPQLHVLLWGNERGK